MASIKDNLVTKLIGFEEGVNIRTLEQISNTIRPRFIPLSNPRISFSEKANRKYSVVLKIDKIPTDPGDGNYTLKIESPKGTNKDIFIRAVGDNKAKSTLSISDSLNSVNQIEGLSFSIINERKFQKAKASARITFQDNSAGTITLRSGTAFAPIQVINSGNATARAADFAAKVNNSQNNNIYNLISAEARANIVFLTQLTPGDVGNTIISKSGEANIDVPSSFSNANKNDPSINFTFSKNYSQPTRVSLGNWIIGVSGMTANSNDAVANRTAAAEAAYKTLKLASDQGELQYAVSDRDNLNIALESNFTGANRNHTPFGTAITSQLISLPSFTGGSLGALATENLGNKTHPRDPSMYSLGLKTPPSYYAKGGDGTRYREVLDSDAQKIKRVTFDINNIINYHARESSVYSRIIGDDTLLITHEPYEGYYVSPSPSDGKKVFQNGLAKSPSSKKFNSSNWKLTSVVNDSNHFRDDIVFEKIFEEIPKKIVIPLDNPNLITQDNNANSIISREYLRVDFTSSHSFINQPKFRVLVYISGERSGNIDSRFSVETRVIQGIAGKTDRIEKKIILYPFSDSISPSDVAEASLRVLFFKSLRFALAAISIPITIEVDEISQELTIEESERVTDIEISLNSGANKTSSTGQSFLSINEKIANELKEYGFTIASDASGDKTIRITFNPLLKGARGPMRFVDDQYANEDSSILVYEVGTEEATTNRELKNRIYSAIEVARRKGHLAEGFTPDVNTPFINFFYNGNHGLSNFNTNLFGKIFHIRALIKENTYRTLKFHFSNGGSNGTKSVQSGRFLKIGDRISANASVTVGSAAIGCHNIQINQSHGIRDVLVEIREAMKYAFNQNKLSIDLSSVFSDHGLLEDAGSNAVHTGFRLYYRNNYVLNNQVNEPQLIVDPPEVLGNFPNFFVYISNDITLGLGTLKLTKTNREQFQVSQTRSYQNLLENGNFSLKKVYGLNDFRNSLDINKVEVNFRDGEKAYYFLSPNHDIQIRSYGFGDQRSQLAHYEDLTLHGPIFSNNRRAVDETFRVFKNTNHLDPVFYINSSEDIRFPIRLKNLGSHLGFEMDGVIEPLEIREILLGRTISESPSRDIKGALLGSYSYCPRRKSSTLISNNINYEISKNTPFFDNSVTKASFMGVSELDVANIDSDVGTEEFIRNFYFDYHGVILKNKEKLFPFFDAEEKNQHNSVLIGNNPENIDQDPIVVQMNNLNTEDLSGLGVVNFRNTSGFQFSSNPHPGSDSFVFGGLRYV